MHESAPATRCVRAKTRLQHPPSTKLDGCACGTRGTCCTCWSTPSCRTRRKLQNGLLIGLKKISQPWLEHLPFPERFQSPSIVADQKRMFLPPLPVGIEVCARTGSGISAAFCVSLCVCPQRGGAAPKGPGASLNFAPMRRLSPARLPTRQLERLPPPPPTPRRLPTRTRRISHGSAATLGVSNLQACARRWRACTSATQSLTLFSLSLILARALSLALLQTLTRPDSIRPPSGKLLPSQPPNRDPSVTRGARSEKGNACPDTCVR